MLIGEYNHSFDAKGRVIFPAKFREDMGEHFILTKGLDNCLFAYSMEEWGKLEQKIRELPLSKSRTLQRFFFSGAVEVEIDKSGRILVPQSLRIYAGLSKDAVIIGVSGRAEIWDKDRWKANCAEITSEMVEEAMESLGF